MMAAKLVGRDDVLETLLAGCGRRRGAMLVGPAGVGKTRLMGEVLDRLASKGWSTERFVATESARAIPFGAMISLLPQGVGEDRTQLLAGMRTSLVERAAGQPLAVAVDDAHHLDEASIACIADLAHRDEALVLLTIRTDDEVPSRFTSLWSSEVLERVTVQPLPATATAELAAAILGGPLDEPLADELVLLARGNPLLLRELLLDAQVSSAIVCAGGTWRLLKPLRSGPRLQELVAARVGRLTSEEARLLELVAVGEPLAASVLTVEEAPLLDVLEQRRLARVEFSDGALSACSDHPLVGEAIRETLPTRRRIEVVRELAERLVADGCRRRGDALRAARWWGESGDVPPSTLSASAAREALEILDLDLAVDLAEMALADGESCELYLVLGNARRLQARTDDAEEALVRAGDLAANDEQRGHVATLHSYVLVHQRAQPDVAIELLEKAAADVTDPNVATSLMSTASHFSGMLGRYDDVLRSTRRILATDGIDREARWTSFVNMLYSQVMLGRLEGIETDLTQAVDPVAMVDEVSPDEFDLLWALRAGVFVQRAELIEGERIIGERLAHCQSTSTMHGATAAIFLHLLIYRSTQLFFPALELALSELDTFDPFMVRPIVLGSAAFAYAQCGQPVKAATALVRLPETRGDPRVLPFVARGQAAVVAAGGDPDRAAEQVAEAGREAVATTHVAFGAVALYDAVRYGRPDLVADDLIEAVAESDSLLLRTMADHAAGARRGDGPNLDVVGHRFAAMGAPQLAALAHGDAAASHAPGSPAARRAAARCSLWARAAFPFEVPEPDAVPDRLSERELDVARSAALGASNRDIAERHFISVRTVENHLHQAYHRLEVANRAELAEVLAPPISSHQDS